MVSGPQYVFNKYQSSEYISGESGLGKWHSESPKPNDQGTTALSSDT
jgi:hypothetical protein